MRMLNRLRWLQIPVSRLSLCIALTGTAFLATTVVAPLPAHAQETAKKKKKKKKTKKGKKGEEAKAGADEAEGDEEEAGAAKADGKADAKAKGDDKPTADEAKAAAEEAKPDPTKRQGAASMKVDSPALSKDFDRSKQADAKRDEAIEELKKLIPKAPTSRKSEMIFRLAELYWQKSKYNYGLEMQAYEKAYQSWADAGGKKNEPVAKDHIARVRADQAERAEALREGARGVPDLRAQRRSALLPRLQRVRGGQQEERGQPLLDADQAVPPEPPGARRVPAAGRALLRRQQRRQGPQGLRARAGHDRRPAC
jgi:hypothetical protein